MKARVKEQYRIVIGTNVTMLTRTTSIVKGALYKWP